MTIKKLSIKEKKGSNEEEKDLLTESFISSGGKTTDEYEEKKKKNDLDSRFTLRIPSHLIEKIDTYRRNRVGIFSRNSWILEAIEEKLNS